MALNPPSGIVKWFNTPISERGWNAFRAQLTGKDYPGTSRKTSYVKLSDEEAEEVIKNIKKDSEGIPLFDEANAPDKREEYQRWLVARYLTKAREEGFESRKKEGIKELEEELGPEGLDELLGLIREEAKVAVASGPSNGGGGGSAPPGSPPPPSSALAVVPKKPDDLVEEDIDSQILSILGLEDVFDLTYEEYASLLKEASIKGRMANSQMTTESIELVTNEFKRVKGKTGKFKVKPKKVDINKVLGKRRPSPKTQLDYSKLLPPSQIVEEKTLEEVSDFKEAIIDELDTIGNKLDELLNQIRTDDKKEKKEKEKLRIDKEKEKKRKKESQLEFKKSPITKTFEKVTKPFVSFFDKIKQFFMTILVGSAVKMLYNFIKDPNSILNPIKSFVNSIIGFLNGIISFLWNMVVSPINFVIGSINTGISGLIDQINNAIKFIPGSKPITAPQIPNVPGPPQIPTIPIQQQEGGGETINIGDISLMSGGGVDNNTGLKISGFGKDTQLVALSPGEVVMSNAAGDFFGRDNLLAMNAMGGGTNEIKTGKLGIQLAQGGGVVFGAGHAAKRKGSNVGTDNLPVQGTTDPRTGVTESVAMMHLIERMQRIVSNNPQLYSNVSFSNITETKGSKGMRERTKTIEGSGKQFIELHLDQWGGGGRSGVISRNLSSYDKNLIQIFGDFGRNFKKGDLAVPDEGGTILELGAIDSKKLETFLDEVKANKYGPATDKLATTLLQAVVAATPPPAPVLPPPTRPTITPLPIPIGGTAQRSSTPSSSAAANQAPVPSFSSEDPNNAHLLVVKSIYNLVG